MTISVTIHQTPERGQRRQGYRETRVFSARGNSRHDEVVLRTPTHGLTCEQTDEVESKRHILSGHYSG